MKVILRKFAKDDCLNYNCILFFVLILSIKLTIKPDDLKFYSQISEKHDETSVFAEGVL